MGEAIFWGNFNNIYKKFIKCVNISFYIFSEYYRKSLCCVVQILGTAPTISIDKTDGCMVYLSEKSLGAIIVSAKSSEMNVLVPVHGGDFVSLLLFL